MVEKIFKVFLVSILTLLVAEAVIGGWTSPTYLDVTGAGWYDSSNAMDGSDSTYAYNYLNYGELSSYLEFQHMNYYVDRIRVKTNYTNSQGNIYIDYKEDAGSNWSTAYNGAFDPSGTTEITLPSTKKMTISRISFRQQYDDIQLKLYEYQLFLTESPPVVSTYDAINITVSEATLEGWLSKNWGYETETWFEWGKTTSYGNTTSKTTMSETNPIAFNISGLEPDTTYHFRAVAENQYGISYGDDVTFSTNPIVPPTVITEDPSDVTGSQARLNGRIMDLGGGDCKIWFEWGELSLDNSTPKVSRSYTGYFNELITSGIEKGKNYKYRVVAENSAGTSYGEILSFSTTVEPTISTESPVTFQEATDTLGGATIQVYKAILPGNLVSTGGADCRVYFKYGTGGLTKATPLEDKTSTGAFTSTTPDTLMAGKTLHYQAIAQNEIGRAYGSEETATIPSAIPSVITSTPSSVGKTTANIRGNLVYLGGENCNAWFEWGETASYGHTTPKQSRSATGDFIQSISGLNTETTYHYRAVAENSKGTVYGEDQEFTAGSPTPTPTPTTTPMPTPTPTTTPTPSPTVTSTPDKTHSYSKPGVLTGVADLITARKAILHGELTDTGNLGCAVWFEFGKTISYGIETKKLSKIGKGAFSIEISDLDPDTNYHFRAVARNSRGRSNGSDMLFTTEHSSVKTNIKNAGRWFNKPVSIVLECSAINTACTGTKYCLNKGKWVDGNLIEIQEDGNYLIEFYSIGKDANEIIRESWVGLDSEGPEPIKNFKLSLENKTVKLSWEETKDSLSGVKEYFIYKGDRKIGRQKKPGFVDASIDAGKIYKYSVSALDFAGNESQRTPLKSINIPDQLSNGNTTQGSVPPVPAEAGQAGEQYSALIVYLIAALILLIILLAVFERQKIGNGLKKSPKIRKKEEKTKRKPFKEIKVKKKADRPIGDLALSQEVNRLRDSLMSIDWGREFGEADKAMDGQKEVQEKAEVKKLDGLIELVKKDIRKLRK